MFPLPNPHNEPILDFVPSSNPANIPNLLYIRSANLNFIQYLGP